MTCGVHSAAALVENLLNAVLILLPDIFKPFSSALRMKPTSEVSSEFFYPENGGDT
jgi:hypothetical protein